MRSSLSCILILSVTPAGVSRAQQSPGMQPKSTRAVRLEPTSLVIQQAPPAKDTQLESNIPASSGFSRPSALLTACQFVRSRRVGNFDRL
jgi:hypothetical protein